MKTIRPYCCIASLFCFTTVQADSNIQIATEEFPPLSYSENGVIKGTATDKVNCILKAANIAHSMKIYPWTRAYNNALNKPEYCVFTTAKTPERDNLFQWVSPLLINRSVLVAKADSTISLNTLDEAKAYKIGVQSEDAGAKALAGKGFANLDQATSVDKSLLKLKSGRVDMVAMAESLLNDLNAKGEQLKAVQTILEIEMGLACNLKMDQMTVKKMQDALASSCQ